MTDDARRRILERLKRVRRADVPLPGELPETIVFDDPRAKFAEMLRLVGGTPLDVADRDAARAMLAELPVVRQAKQIVSYVPDLVPGTPELDTADDPHALAGADLAVCPAEFWVAENGAVWVTDRQIGQRVSLFLAQHLILIVPGSQWAMQMHDAYRRIGSIDRPFGGFISGPSKTADIEQSLVIGAHGARSLHVVRIG
ncbi:MAG TPA: hypothetical protein DCQ98_14835 [Planctomycetaceae bacterium]|nr:hypothetical protein [Planctomycetaceae bacterium]HRF00937.1 LUD domain-containing protein [Pirellulaceae bacterium]